MIHECTPGDRSVVYVFDDDWPFAYTVGNTLHGFPELLTFGLATRQAADMLAALSGKMTNQKRGFHDGEMIDMGGPPIPRAFRCTPLAREKYTLQVTERLGRDDYAVMQIIIPDRAGHYPTDPQVTPRWHGMPMLWNS
jgi:hypothetical protein